MPLAIPGQRPTQLALKAYAPRASSPSLQPGAAEPSAARRTSVGPRSEQATLPELRVPARAFGAAALADEATLDIPAYLRRAAAQE